MNTNLHNLIFHILNGLKNKEFSYHADRTTAPMFGRQGNEYFVNNGRLAGSVEVIEINQNTVRFSIKVSWEYRRDKYELIRSAQENRRDYGIYIFTATLNSTTQIVELQELDWIAFDQDPLFAKRLCNHDSEIYAKAGLKECLITPLSGHLNLPSNENFLIQELKQRKIYINFNGRDFFMSNTDNTDNRVSQSEIYIQSGNIGIGKMIDSTIKGSATVAGKINEAEPQNLAEAAAEIQELLQQLEKSYPANTTAGKMAIATEAIKQIESNPTLLERVMSALKAGSVSALESALNHPAASFFIGALQDLEATRKVNDSPPDRRLPSQST